MKFFIALPVFFTTTLFADPLLHYDGMITQAFEKHGKNITLMRVNLSQKIIKTIQKNATSTYLMKSTPSTEQSIQLGMNGIPVADQGDHGSCVNFAIIEAISAIEAKPYSELCSLSLGKYLENVGYKQSGWNGQLVRNVLARIEEFGLVSLNDQKKHGCGGLHEYPLNGEESQAITPEEYHQISIDSSETGLQNWSNYYDIEQWVNQKIPVEQILNHTKQALSQKHRVILSFLIPSFVDHFGAVGSYQSEHDTWVLNEKLLKDIQSYLAKSWLWGGHAVIITGFDDAAEVLDDEGQSHRGILTLRNSWGESVGNHGDFYMSYDYFKLLAVELNELANQSTN
jgi:Papain family cysteine protease